MEELKFIAGLVLIIVIGMSAMIGVIVGADIIYNQNYCKTMQSLHTDFEFRWELWGGCMVKLPSGYWISASEYQYFEGDINK